MENFTIIWLDVEASSTTSSFRRKLGDVKTFTNPDACTEYIFSHENAFIYLILSGSYAKSVVPQIYECSNVIEIFLFCGSIATYSEWGIDYCEKMLMYDHEDDLLERLWKDLELKLQEQANICLKKADELKKKAMGYNQPCG